MKKKFLILFGVLGLAFMVTAIVLLLSGPRMKNQPSVQAFDTIAALPPEDAVFLDHEPFDASEMKLPAINAANLERGKVYYGYYCIFCHGDDGRGNGPVGQSYVPKPADLRRDSVRLYDIEKLYYSTFTGTGHSPVLERVIPEHQRPFILAYIRHGVFTRK